MPVVVAGPLAVAAGAHEGVAVAAGTAPHMGAFVWLTGGLTGAGATVADCGLKLVAFCEAIVGTGWPGIGAMAVALAVVPRFAASEFSIAITLFPVAGSVANWVCACAIN